MNEKQKDAFITVGEKQLIGVYPFGTASSDGTAQKITTFEDDERIKGRQRVFEDFIESLPTGDNYFLFETSQVIDRTVLVLPPKLKSETGPVTVEVYRNATITDNGTELDTHNPIEDTTFEHQARLFVSPTFSDIGDRIIGQKFGAQGGFFTPDIGGTGEISQPSVVTTNYLLKINNGADETIDLNAFLGWFEIPTE